MQYLLIGKFGSPFKLKGELSFHMNGNCDHLVSDFSLFISRKNLNPIFLSYLIQETEINENLNDKQSSEDELFLELPQFSYRPYKKCYRILFNGLDSIDIIKYLINLSVYTLKSSLPSLDDSFYYHYKLVGSKTYVNSDFLGYLKSICDFGTGDLCEIEILASNKFNPSKKLRQIFIPFSENYIEKIDTKNKNIIFKSSIEVFF